MAGAWRLWFPPGFLLTFLEFFGRELQKPTLAVLSKGGVWKAIGWLAQSGQESWTVGWSHQAGPLPRAELS